MFPLRFVRGVVKYELPKKTSVVFVAQNNLARAFGGGR
jgi:hypothetical protein